MHSLMNTLSRPHCRHLVYGNWRCINTRRGMSKRTFSNCNYQSVNVKWTKELANNTNIPIHSLIRLTIVYGVYDTKGSTGVYIDSSIYVFVRATPKSLALFEFVFVFFTISTEVVICCFCFPTRWSNQTEVLIFSTDTFACHMFITNCTLPTSLEFTSISFLFCFVRNRFVK